jgi:hypothetical protein
MVDMAVEVLFAKFGSLVVELTVAVLLDCDEELNVFAVTLMVTTAELPTLRLPRLQTTVVVEDV